jgi:hypothetical protein
MALSLGLQFFGHVVILFDKKTCTCTVSQTGRRCKVGLIIHLHGVVTGVTFLRHVVTSKKTPPPPPQQQEGPPQQQDAARWALSSTFMALSLGMLFQTSGDM